jgi:MFS family permease
MSAAIPIEAGQETALTARAELTQRWPIMLAGLLGVTFGVAALFFYTIGVFITPLEQAYGWSRTALSAGTLMTTMTMAATSPFIGLLIDRVSLRLVAVVSMLGLSAGYYALSNLPNSIGVYFALMITLSIVSAGTTPVVFSRLINQWFDKSRGLALGVAMAGTGVAGAIAPRLLAPYVAEEGWQAGYLALSIAVLCAVPVVGLLIRERPKGRAKAGGGAIAAETGTVFPVAVRAPLFWFVASVFFFAALGTSGLMVHIIPMLTDAGLTPARAGSIAGIMGLAVIAGRVLSGATIDRFFAPYVGAILFTITATGCVAMAFAGVGLAPVAAFLLGFAMGAEVDLIGYLVARYFGMRSYGSIYGTIYAIFLAGAAFGQLGAGWVFDSFGDYTFALLASAVVLVLSAVIAATQLGPFPKRQ